MLTRTRSEALALRTVLAVKRGAGAAASVAAKAAPPVGAVASMTMRPTTLGTDQITSAQITEAARGFSALTRPGACPRSRACALARACARQWTRPRALSAVSGEGIST